MDYLEEISKEATHRRIVALSNAHKAYLNDTSSTRDAKYRATVYQANKLYDNYIAAIKVEHDLYMALKKAEETRLKEEAEWFAFWSVDQ